MKLTYKDIKDSVHNLCFLEESEYEEYEGLIRESLNFALLEIARQFPLRECLRIEHHFDKEDRGYISYDMAELTKAENNGKDVFMGFSDKFPLICLSDKNGVGFADYDILEDRYLVLGKTSEGVFEIFYKKYPERITEETRDNHEIEFRAEVANLIPLLCAWRIFKDDDETKSALYYNEYLRMKEEISLKDELRKPPVRIGFIHREGTLL